MTSQPAATAPDAPLDAAPEARGGLAIPRRELVTLLAYAETGSHKAAARRLGIAETTARQRVSMLARRVGAANAAQAVWLLRRELEQAFLELAQIESKPVSIRGPARPLRQRWVTT